MQVEKILAECKNNPNIPVDMRVACLKALFESSRTYGVFTSYFGAEIYCRAATYYSSGVHGHDRPSYAILGVTKVLEDVEISQQNRPLYQDIKHFLEQDFAIIHDDDAELVRKFAKFFTARIDFKLVPTAGTANFQILSVSDSEAKVRNATWVKKGIGYYVHSYAGRLAFAVKVITDGKFYLILRGVWVPTPEDRTKLIPYWIDYTKLVVNGKIIIDKLTPCWHNKPYNYSLDVKAGEEIKVEVEWLPHRSDT